MTPLLSHHLPQTHTENITAIQFREFRGDIDFPSWPLTPIPQCYPKLCNRPPGASPSSLPPFHRVYRDPGSTHCSPSPCGHTAPPPILSIPILYCQLLVPRNSLTGTPSGHNWPDLRSIPYQTHSHCTLLRTRKVNRNQRTEHIANKARADVSA